MEREEEISQINPVWGKERGTLELWPVVILVINL